MIRKTELALLWVAQVVVNAALLALACWWLNWPEARAWQVAGSLLAAAAVLFLTLWLQCGALSCFVAQEGQQTKEGLPGTLGLVAHFRQALRRIPAFLLWALVFAAILWGVQWLKDGVPQASVRLAQLSGGAARTVARIANWTLFALQWGVVPALLLPFASDISADGFRGWRPRAWRRLRTVTYWIGLAAALVIGIYLPYKLIWWRNLEASISRQAWSAGLRFAIAYLLTLTMWMVLAAILGRSRVQKNSALADS